MFANKQDLEGSLGAQDIRKALDLDAIASHHWAIYGCSAVTGKNLLHAMDWLMQDISSRIFTVD